MTTTTVSMNKNIVINTHSPLLAAAKAMPVYRVTTPRLIAYMFGLITALCLLVGFVDQAIISSISTSVEVIGYSTKPSIIAAESAHAVLADMGSSAAMTVLIDGRAYGTSEDFYADQRKVVNLMIEAASNITFADTEKPAIENLNRGLLAYNQAVGETRMAYSIDPLWGLKTLRWSDVLLKNQLIKSAQALAQANIEPLTQAYNKYNAYEFWLTSLTIVANMILIAAIFFVQFLLFKRTHRLVNVFLAGACLSVIVSAVWITFSIAYSSNHIHTAKKDAFDSILSLYEAKTELYTIKQLETEWLIDPVNRKNLTAEFNDHVHKMIWMDLKDPNNSNTLIRSLDHAVSLERSNDAAGAKKATPNFGGYLGEQMNNITFGLNERQPSTEAVRQFIDYIRVDQQIRDFELNSQHAKALELAKGNLAGQSNFLFRAADSALDKSIAVNNQEFDENVSKAKFQAHMMHWISFLPLTLTFVLTAIGLYMNYQRSGAVEH